MPDQLLSDVRQLKLVKSYFMILVLFNIVIISGIISEPAKVKGDILLQLETKQ